MSRHYLTGIRSLMCLEVGKCSNSCVLENLLVLRQKAIIIQTQLFRAEDVMYTMLFFFNVSLALLVTN